MYKNNIEKISRPSKALLLGSYFILGVSSWLKVWLKKCNYMEYIKSAKSNLRNGYKPLVDEKVEGTISLVFSKGTGECEKELDVRFFNLVKSHWCSQPSIKPYMVGIRGTFLTWLKLG